MSKSTLKNPALAAIVTALNAQHEIAKSKFEAFESDILINRLCTGLHCLKAHALFNIADPSKRNPKGNNQASSRRDLAAATGFEGWLAEAAPWLKKSTAYKYMTAVKGLGLDDNASEEAVAEALALAQERRIGPVSLASLIAAAVERISPPPEPTAKIEQTEFEFLRDGLSAFREQADALLALKAQLHENPDMERVASARVYGLLYQLTGTHWKPSDEPDDLASVNPDQIDL